MVEKRDGEIHSFELHTNSSYKSFFGELDESIDYSPLMNTKYGQLGEYIPIPLSLGQLLYIKQL